MCLIIACVFAYLSFSFYEEGNMVNASINGAIALFFMILLIRNIVKTRKMIKDKKKKN